MCYFKASWPHLFPVLLSAMSTSFVWVMIALSLAPMSHISFSAPC